VIDPSLLPSGSLIDTGVFIRAFGQRVKDPHAAHCVEFVEAMRSLERDVFIAAPTLSEVLRFGSGTQTPMIEGFVTLTFDRQAALLLGGEYPEDTLIKFREQHGGTLHYFKYDAMILACAERWKIQSVVALDAKLIKLAQARGLTAMRPSDFQSAQGSLKLVDQIKVAEPDDEAEGE
jgi:predicted nucleic acid-binding protein